MSRCDCGNERRTSHEKGKGEVEMRGAFLRKEMVKWFYGEVSCGMKGRMGDARIVPEKGKCERAMGRGFLKKEGAKGRCGEGY